MPRKTKKAATSGSSTNAADSETESQLICDGCTNSIAMEEVLHSSICKVWLHCYSAGVPRSRFIDTSTTFVCIPCSLITNQSVVIELRGEIAALKAEIVELNTALETTKKKLDSANKKLEIISTSSSAGVVEAEWTAIVKKSAKQQKRVGNPTTTLSSSNAKQPTPSSCTAVSAASPSLTGNAEVKQVTKMKVSGARHIWGTHCQFCQQCNH